MLPLLAAALFVQDAPDPPPTPPAAPATPALPAPPAPAGLATRPGTVQIYWNGDDGPVSWVTPRSDGALAPVAVPTAPGGLRLMGDRLFLRQSAPPTGPLTGALKLTAEDGTVTEYKAEFTPDPPATPESEPKARLGVILLNTEPDGDPPGLRVRVMENSPAAKAGVEDGDRVISVGGAPIVSADALREAVKKAAGAAAAVRLKVVRGDGEADGGGDGEAKAVRIIRLRVTPEATGDDDGATVAVPEADAWLAAVNAQELAFGPGSTSGVQFGFGPATVQPRGRTAPGGESPEIRLERAALKIEAAQARLEAAKARFEAAEQVAARAEQAAEMGEAPRAEALAARVKAVEYRAAIKVAELEVHAAELDRRAAEEAAGAGDWADRGPQRIDRLRETIAELGRRLAEQAERIERLSEERE